MKAKKSKKTAKKKSAPKSAAKKKAAPKKKAMKAKTKTKVAAKSKAPANTKAPAKKKSGGFTVQELFQMKIERESAALNPDQHKSDIPAQDQHSPEAPKDHSARKSGFGGSRHH